MNKFYLKADCLNPPDIWRKCEVVSEHIMIGTNLKMYLVEVEPPFESDFFEEKISRVLLGMINSKWDITKVGEPCFVVDILHCKNPRMEVGIKMSMLRRLGMGNIADRPS